MKFNFMEDKEICAISAKKTILLFVAAKYLISSVPILLVVFFLFNFNVAYAWKLNDFPHTKSAFCNVICSKFDLL